MFLTNATLAIRCTRLAQEARGKAFTIADVGTHLGHPYTDNDLRRLLRFCRTFGVRLNTDGEAWHERLVNSCAINDHRTVDVTPRGIQP